MERSRFRSEINVLHIPGEDELNYEGQPIQPDIVCLYLLDISAVFGNNKTLIKEITRKLQDKFNALDQSPLRTVKFRFVVVYESTEPTHREKSRFRSLDFPVYIMDRQHTEGIVSKLMRKHQIPDKVGGTDIYEYAAKSWKQDHNRGLGIPSSKGHYKVGFIKAHKIFHQARNTGQGFVNCITHEIGHMGNKFQHSKMGIMKYPIPLDVDLDFASDDRIRFLGDLVRLRQLNRIPTRSSYIQPPIFRELAKFPRSNSTTGSIGSPATTPIALFPPTPGDPLSADKKFETGLKLAIAMVENARRLKPGSFPLRFTFVDISSPLGSFPSTGYFETQTDYIASEAKVAVMYSAYALRDMVKRFAVATGANPANLFYLLTKQMNPAIVKSHRAIALSLLMDMHRVPSYKNVFALTPMRLGHRVETAFTKEFDKAIEGMIVPSNNVLAGVCVRGIGYGYLNGALVNGGFLDATTDNGLWVGGDYQQGKRWPYVRIVSKNDGFVAQAGTTRDMAKLVSLIMTDRVLDATSCREMRGRLARAAKGVDTPWIARTGVFKSGTITHNKLGLGPLKSGMNVRSEVSVYKSPAAKDRRYVVAWQNLVGLSPVGLADVAKIIKTAITEFEK